MKSSLSGLLLLEALVCGIPATFLAVVYLPWAAIVAIGQYQDSPAFAAANAAMLGCCVVALAQYWHLAICTMNSRPYRFGRAFFAGALCGASAGLVLLVFLPPLALVALLAAASAVHFARLQLRNGARPTASLLAGGGP
nr:hypothetical protein [uncultured Roseateles sp.]